MAYFDRNQTGALLAGLAFTAAPPVLREISDGSQIQFVAFPLAVAIGLCLRAMERGGRTGGVIAGLAITADIPLASRCLKAGAHVLGPTGRPFTEHSIGMALAMRDLNAHLRETGEIKGYNASFASKDRSRFLGELERLIQQVRKSG